MATNKDFELIASVLNRVMKGRYSSATKLGIVVVDELSMALEDSNPRFNPDRFSRAVWLDSDDI